MAGLISHPTRRAAALAGLAVELSASSGGNARAVLRNVELSAYETWEAGDRFEALNVVAKAAAEIGSSDAPRLFEAAWGSIRQFGGDVQELQSWRREFFRGFGGYDDRNGWLEEFMLQLPEEHDSNALVAGAGALAGVGSVHAASWLAAASEASEPGDYWNLAEIVAVQAKLDVMAAVGFLNRRTILDPSAHALAASAVVRVLATTSPLLAEESAQNGFGHDGYRRHHRDQVLAGLIYGLLPTVPANGERIARRIVDPRIAGHVLFKVAMHVAVKDLATADRLVVEDPYEKARTLIGLAHAHLYGTVRPVDLKLS
jgi:hypothetical protein